ncbi:MAG: DUF309 domain-containing protein [Campylobacterota bacterium]|nr:DUF309 domain-containing protein [Campylobacterota bacterium]
METMLKMNDDVEGALREYLKLLDEEEYFEAHEVLEEAWHPLRLKKHPLANLVKGFINGAIAFEHIKRNRNNVQKKAQKVLSSYERYKHLCTEDVEHTALFKQASQKIEALKQKHAEIF